MRFIYFLTLVLINSILLNAQTITSTVIKKPSELRCNDVAVKLNNVVFGSIPPNSESKPVIIFVHGWFDNGYSWFMAKNKWYENCYNAGYRTAYFFQHFSDKFEKNGKVVAEMIRATCRHYNTNKIIAICHSKGGIDIDYALYNENVWDSVQGVITLSTPFKGAPICDLIAFPLIRVVLENIPIVAPIFRGEGTYQMQTANMERVVRPMLDNHPNNNPAKFRNFAAWSFLHPTEFPATIPDDILKDVFPDYQPLCIELPGSGALAGGLMTFAMGATGILTNITTLLPQYQNTHRNYFQNDGLVPLYSSIRPGSYLFSELPPSQQAYLNHIDITRSSYMWNMVLPQIEYFEQHPQFRLSNNSISLDSKTEPKEALSDIQFVQSNQFTVSDISTNQLILIGNYTDEKITVYDEQNTIVKEIPLNITTNSMFDVFHPIDLSSLAKNKKYILESSVQLTGFFKDGNAAAIQLTTTANKDYTTNEPLNIEVALKDWNENTSQTTVKGFLSRTIDADGNVLHDNSIPISFTYDELNEKYVCKEELNIPTGIYNLAVFAEGNTLKRFTTTSISIKQNKNNSLDKAVDFTLYPNPVKDNFVLQFNALQTTKYQLQIVDVVGKVVYHKQLDNIVGLQQIQLNSNEFNLANGSYFVTLSDNSSTKSKLLIVQ